MANTQPVSFINQYNDQVHNAFMETQTLLRKTVNVHSGVVGSQDHFPIIGSITAFERTALLRNQNLPASDAPHTKVTVDLKDYYARIWLDDLDKIKTNVDLQREYSKITAAAINKQIDQLISAALDATTTTITTTAGGWTFGKFQEALAKFNQLTNNVQAERYFVCSWEQLSEMFSDARVTSSDYVGAALLPAQSGQIGKFFGVNVIVSNDLTVAANVRNCFLYTPAAVGLSMGKDLTTSIALVDEKDSWLSSAKMSMGVKIIDPSGVVKMVCTENGTTA